jgi:PIN domain nuclease of toxin-antitoxin system
VKALLDTHTFIWWNTAGGERVSARARELIEDGDAEILVSIATVWEIAIKVAKGSLAFPSHIGEYIPSRLQRHGFDVLPIEIQHAVRVADLPPIHGDPFDRILIAQAQVEDLPILTADPAISRYDVETIW